MLTFSFCLDGNIATEPCFFFPKRGIRSTSLVPYVLHLLLLAEASPIALSTARCYCIFRQSLHFLELMQIANINYFLSAVLFSIKSDHFL